MESIKMSQAVTVSPILRTESHIRKVLSKILRDAGLKVVSRKQDIASAGRWLMQRNKLCTVQGVRSFNLADIARRNLEGLASLYRQYDLTPKDAAQAALRNYRLFLQDPSWTESNIKNLRQAFGEKITLAPLRNHAFGLLARNPQMLSYPWQKIHDAFVLNLTFIASPFVCLSGEYYSKVDRQKCVSYLVSGHFMKTSEVLLRMAGAELLGLEDRITKGVRFGDLINNINVDNSLHLPTVQETARAVLRTLDYDPNQRVITPPPELMGLKDQRALQRHLMIRRADYERSIVLAFDSSGRPVAKEMWPFKVLADIGQSKDLPTTPEQKKNLVARLVLSKLVKGYTLACAR